MKGQYHLIRTFNLLKDFRKYMLSNKTMRDEFINYGTNWMDYLASQRTSKLTRDGKIIRLLSDNAERIYIEYQNSKYTDKAMALERLAELKNNAIPTVDQKRIQQILDRRERKARKHGISIER